MKAEQTESGWLITKDDTQLSVTADEAVELIAKLRRPAEQQLEQVYVSLYLYAGNERAGAKSWAKRITGIDPSKPSGYGLLGDFADKKAAHPAGSYLVIGGFGGSWKKPVRHRLLAAGKGRCRVRTQKWIPKLQRQGSGVDRHRFRQARQAGGHQRTPRPCPGGW